MPNIYYDFETTGLNWYTDRIIEIAATNDKGESFHTLCNIGDYIIPIKVTQITGIKNTDLVGAPPEREAFNRFLQFIRRTSYMTREPVYLIAHNSSNFDQWFVRSRAYEFGIRIPSNWRHVDTLHMAKILLPGMRSSMKALCEYFDILQNLSTPRGR